MNSTGGEFMVFYNNDDSWFSQDDHTDKDQLRMVDMSKNRANLDKALYKLGRFVQKAG